MIDVVYISDLLQKELENTSKFVVDVQVSPSNDIVIEMDDMEGSIAVEDCIAVSKSIENQLDREQEDFSLQVASPGLSNPFKVHPQYVKNIGREVRVLKKDGLVEKGLLTNVDESAIELSNKVKERIEGRKAKQWVDKKVNLNFEEIKETTIIISFT